MPVFYHLLSVLLVAFVVSILAPIADFNLFARKSGLSRFVLVFRFIGIGWLSFIVTLVLALHGLRWVQGVVAVPYIRQATIEQCDIRDIVVSPENFFASDSLYRWETEDKSLYCYFSHVEWKCSCP